MKFKTALAKPLLWVISIALTGNFIKSAPITYMSGIFLHYQFGGRAFSTFILPFKILTESLKTFSLVFNGLFVSVSTQD